MRKQRDLTEGNIVKGFLMFALPLLGGSLFQQLYSTVDMLFVGNFLGKNDAAAVGASGILVTCLIGLFTGISVGAGVVAAQYFGAGKNKELEDTIWNTLVFGAVGGILLMAVGFCGAEAALKCLNTPETLMEGALEYIRIYFLAMAAMILYNMCAGLLRAMGDSQTPFFVLAAGGILNVFMDGIFLLVLKQGIAGAAMATVISQTFTAIALLLNIMKRNPLIWKRRIRARLLGKIIKIGFPLGIQSMIITLSNIFVQYYINGFGENTVAAFAVYFKAENLVYLPIMAFGQAMVTFTGQNMGAGKYKRIFKGALSCNLLAGSLILILGLAAWKFGQEILGAFCKDTEVIEIGMEIIKVTFPLYFLYSIMEVTGGIIRGIGKSLPSMIIIVINLCGIRILLLHILVNLKNSVSAVAAVYPATWLLAAICFIVYYICWKKGAVSGAWGYTEKKESIKSSKKEEKKSEKKNPQAGL